jgi:hypothetical protein
MQTKGSELLMLYRELPIRGRSIPLYGHPIEESAWGPDALRMTAAVSVACLRCLMPFEISFVIPYNYGNIMELPMTPLL